MNSLSIMNLFKMYLLVASITIRIHATLLDDLYLEQFTQILEKTAASYRDTPKDYCTDDSHCPNSENCFNKRCTDLCPGTCGIDAICTVLNHTLSCTCFTCYYGDPYIKCKPYTGNMIIK